MLVKIGPNFINADQITHINDSKLPGDRGRKVINIHMSSRVCLYYIAGEEGYAAALDLRGKLVANGRLRDEELGTKRAALNRYS